MRAKISVTRYPLVFLEMGLPDDGVQFECSHRIEYNGVDRVLVSIEHLFDLRNIFPHDNTPFLVDWDRTVMIPKTQYSCGFFVFLTQSICCDFGVRNSNNYVSLHIYVNIPPDILENTRPDAGFAFG